MPRRVVIEILVAEGDSEDFEHEGYYTIDEAIEKLEEMRKQV